MVFALFQVDLIRCGPCKRMHPIFDQLSEKYPNVIFLRIDVDKNRQLSAEYSASSIPTFVIVFHGSEVDRVVGFNPGELEQKIIQYSQSAQTFQGTGNTLGGVSAISSSTVREMRLKKFNNVKSEGTASTTKVSKLLNRLSDDACSSEEEEIVSSKQYTNFVWNSFVVRNKILEKILQFVILSERWAFQSLTSPLYYLCTVVITSVFANANPATLPIL